MVNSPVHIAGRILEWEENGKLVDDESWVQNNAPALAHAYMELYVWREAFADLIRTAIADGADSDPPKVRHPNLHTEDDS